MLQPDARLATDAEPFLDTRRTDGADVITELAAFALKSRRQLAKEKEKGGVDLHQDCKESSFAARGPSGRPIPFVSPQRSTLPPRLWQPLVLGRGPPLAAFLYQQRRRPPREYQLVLGPAVQQVPQERVVACTFVNNPSVYVDRPLCTVPRIFLQ